MENQSYVRLGTLTSFPALASWVGRRDGEDAFFLINQVVHGKKSKALFRDFYRFSQNRPEYSDFIELYNDGQSFCAVFAFRQAPSLAARYPDGEGSTLGKLKNLAAALLRVNAALTMPLPVVLSVLQPDNILLDEDDTVFLRYRLLPEYLDAAEDGLFWDCLGALLDYLFSRELRSFRYQALRSIRAKCRARLYGSLSEMIKELERAAVRIEDTDFNHLFKRRFLQAKDRLGKAAGLSTLALGVFVVIYLVNSFTKPKALPVTGSAEIGNITYVVSGDTERELALADSAPSQAVKEPDYSAIGPDTPLEFEDYVVRPRDTLDTVCRRQYGSAGYRTPVALFNGLAEDAVLTAGSILRLPLKSQLAPYER